jgi:hypothetical protein
MPSSKRLASQWASIAFSTASTSVASGTFLLAAPTSSCEARRVRNVVQIRPLHNPRPTFRTSSVRPDMRHPMPIVVTAAMPVMMAYVVPAYVPAAVIAMLPGPVTVVVPSDVGHSVPIMMTAPVPIVVDTGMTAAMLGASPVGGRRGRGAAAKDHRRRKQQGRQERHSFSDRHGSSPLTLRTPRHPTG